MGFRVVLCGRKCREIGKASGQKPWFPLIFPIKHPNDHGNHRVWL
jgi:hypothetical protein